MRWRSRLKAELPASTVTFLLTGIEGSTHLREQHPEAMRPALDRHGALLRAALHSHGGHIFKTSGDPFCAAFAAALAAVMAADGGSGLGEGMPRIHHQ